jgi:hypothetical protein
MKIIFVVFVICILIIVGFSISIYFEFLDLKSLEFFLDKYKLFFTVNSVLLILAGFSLSIYRAIQQQQIISLQNSSLITLTKNNQLVQYKNNIEHFKNNLDYFTDGHIENVSISDRSMLIYHRFYSSSHTGDFNLDSVFFSDLSCKLEKFILLLTNYTSNIEYKNTNEGRFIDICEWINDMSSFIGLSITLPIRTNNDDGRVFPSEVYQYVSSFFIALVTLLDKDLGKWRLLSLEFAKFDYRHSEDDSVPSDEPYESRCLDLLTCNIK